jgi:hypothetical protein
MLLGIWSLVLRLEEIGVEEDFFDLGEHSLLATQVMSRCAGICGNNIATFLNRQRSPAWLKDRAGAQGTEWPSIACDLPVSETWMCRSHLGSGSGSSIN